MQLKEIKEEHDNEAVRLQELIRRERNRWVEDRAHFEQEADQVRKIAHERAEAEIERIKEEEEAKRRTLAKKHAVRSTLHPPPLSLIFPLFLILTLTTTCIRPN